MHRSVFIFIIIELILLIDAAKWGYPDMDTNAPKQPLWGGMCESGVRQSPIDLNTTIVFEGKNYPDFLFDNYDSNLAKAIIKNSGHSIQINISPGQKYKISGSGLSGVYVLEQLHWHWWSEHRIDGRRYPLEVHLVHHSEQYANTSVAAANKNGIAVLAVLYHIEGEQSETMAKVVSHFDNIESQAGRQMDFNKALNPNELLPKNRKNYFRYEGSLTTPTCSESVIWTVFSDTIPITIKQVDEFTQMRDDQGLAVKNNFRLIQPAFNRAVIYVNDEPDNIDSSATKTSGLILFISFLAYLVSGLVFF